MTRYVALLRAVNLGSHKKVAMPALRALLDGMGYSAVETYLQSGNAVFTADDSSPERVAAAIEDRLAAGLGLSTEVILRTGEQLQAVVADVPMEVGDPAKHTVLFLRERPAPDWLGDLDLAGFAPEEMHAADREIYLRLPNGIGRAKLPVALGRRLKVPATMRNWNTVTALASRAV